MNRPLAKTLFVSDGNAGRIFRKLKLMREFEKVYMPSLETLEDFDLMLEIGFYQSQDEPLTLKRLFLLNIDPLQPCNGVWQN